MYRTKLIWANSWPLDILNMLKTSAVRSGKSSNMMTTLNLPSATALCLTLTWFLPSRTSVSELLIPILGTGPMRLDFQSGASVVSTWLWHLYGHFESSSIILSYGVQLSSQCADHPEYTKSDFQMLIVIQSSPVLRRSNSRHPP